MKHKMWSRLLSMALAVMMIASIVPNSAFAEAASEITSTSQVQVEETPVEETQTPQEEVTVPEAETPAEPSTEPAPTEEPVAEPTAEPIVEPTAEPTQAPAETVAPSEEPSAEPTAAPETTEIPDGTAVPTETPAPSASPLPSETPVPSESPAPSGEPAIDGQALLDELMAIEDDEAFIKAVNELTEEQAAALEALGEEALAEYALRVETLTAQEETVELNAEDKEFTAAVKDAEGVTVTVKVPAGSLPVNAQLVAEMIEQDTEKYTKAEEALADETLNEQPTEYAGMVAMDIRFEVDGEEIEPLQPVEVTIDAQALLPEDADPETVAVQHLKEDETGEVVAVQTVADATEETGDVTVEATQTEEPAMDMASTFAVDGFSTFTITWNYSRRVTIYYVDTDGVEIEGTQKYGENFARREWVDLSDYAGQIEGYEFVEYKYGSDFDESDHMADASEEPQICYYNGYRYRLSEYGNGTQIFYYASADERNIYLVYEENNQSGGGSDVTSATVTTGKTLVLQQGQQAGGLYDLTLSVSGDRGSSEQKAMVDVLFILDESNSMGEKWGNQKRIAAAKAAISQIMGRGNDVGLSDNENLDVQYALVGFGGGDSQSGVFGSKYKDAGIEKNWTSDVNSVYNAIPDITYSQYGYSTNRYGGGTNYEAGFRTGKEALEAGREDAMTVVIFISDGGPGYYYNNNGYTDGTGNPDNYDENALKHGVDECKDLNADYFYFVGVTSDVTGDVFTNITNAVPVPTANKKSIKANEPEELLKAFADIEEQITFYACQDVTLTDTMSQYAEVVADESGNYIFTINVMNGDVAKATQTITLTAGETQKTEDLDGVGSVTLTFQDGIITLDFPDNYQLEKDHTYSVTTTVKPTEEATAAGTEKYNGRGDAGTGTHAGQSGFFSNVSESSKVTFKPTVNGQAGEEKSELFPKPVIQIFDPGDVQMDTPAHTKQAILNDDGTYDLTLTVSGSTGTATKKAQVDVLMVVDISSSMVNNGSRRLANTKTAMKALVDELETNDTVDARYSIVTFGGAAYGTGQESDAKDYLIGWHENVTESEIDGIQAYGNTNYQAGLRQAAKMLESARPTATTVVVFLSDGAPNITIGTSQNNNMTQQSEAWKATLEEASKISCSQFYAVGISSTQRTFMVDVQNTVNSGSPAQYIEANSDGSNLADKFKDIAGSVTALACENVTITDILSQYAEAVLNTNGTPEKLKVKVTDANGTDVTEVEQQAGNITPVYNGENKTVTLEFDDSYRLKPNYTYAVTLKIKPTDEAIQYLNENGGVYPDTPAPGTGTHAANNEKGFFSNTEATLTYQVTGIPGQNTVSYDKPVIRVNKGDLLITKTIEGLSEDEITALEDTLVFTYTNVDNPNDKGTVHFAGMNLVNGVYQATVKNLDANAKYTVTEAGYQVDGYDCTTSQPTEPVVIPNGETATAAFTNTYTPSNMELTIVKEIQGVPYGDGRDMFSFKIICRDSANKDNIGKVWYVHLDGAGEKTITLPVGKYEVTEMDNIHYKFVGVAPEPTDTLYELKENATIIFTNEPVKSNIPTDGGGVENQFDLRGQDIVITANKIDEDTEVTPTTSGQ